MLAGNLTYYDIGHLSVYPCASYEPRPHWRSRTQHDESADLTRMLSDILGTPIHTPSSQSNLAAENFGPSSPTQCSEAECLESYLKGSPGVLTSIGIEWWARA
jgi:hypothetical protein